MIQIKIGYIFIDILGHKYCGVVKRVTKNFNFEGLLRLDLKRQTTFLINNHSQIFYNNMVLIDSKLPEIVRNILLLYQKLKISSVSELCVELKKSNPLNYDSVHERPFYESKLKRFLIALTFGMSGSCIWEGTYNGPEVYVVFREKQTHTEFEISNRPEFENYLFENAKISIQSLGRPEMEQKQDSVSNDFKTNFQINLV